MFLAYMPIRPLASIHSEIDLVPVMVGSGLKESTTNPCLSCVAKS